MLTKPNNNNKSSLYLHIFFNQINEFKLHDVTSIWTYTLKLLVCPNLDPCEVLPQKDQQKNAYLKICKLFIHQDNCTVQKHVHAYTWKGSFS